MYQYDTYEEMLDEAYRVNDLYDAVAPRIHGLRLLVQEDHLCLTDGHSTSAYPIRGYMVATDGLADHIARWLVGEWARERYLNRE